MRLYGAELEADLFGVGVDLRDFHRPSGGPSQLTIRRLSLISRAVPLPRLSEAIRLAQRRADGKSVLPRKSDRIAERAEHYRRLAAEQEADG